ncbi:MAG: DUF58 domain-containing protein [Pseudomonadota bacterium]
MIRPGPLALLGLALGVLPALALPWSAAAGPLLGVLLVTWLGLTALSVTNLPRREHLLVEPAVRGVALQGHSSSLTLRLTNLHFQRMRVEAALLAGGPLEVTAPTRTLWLEPGATEALSFTLRPLRRGDLPLGHLQISLSGPNRWLERSAAFDLPGSLTVHPRPVSAAFWSRLLPEPFTARHRPSRERGLFLALRPHQPGEDPRDLCWSACARTGQRVVRTWERPDAGPVLLLLDRGAGMAAAATPEQDRLDRAVALASSLARQLSTAGRSVLLGAWSQGLDLWIDGRRGGLAAIQRALGALEPDAWPWDPSTVAEAIAPRLPADTLVLILTEPDGEPGALAQGLARLAARHDVRVLLVGDTALEAAARRPVRAPEDAWRLAAALDLLAQRRQAIDRWRAAGAAVLDAGVRAGSERQPVAR